jgi:hypothetical protein
MTTMAEPCDKCGKLDANTCATCNPNFEQQANLSAQQLQYALRALEHIASGEEDSPLKCAEMAIRHLKGASPKKDKHAEYHAVTDKADLYDALREQAQQQGFRSIADALDCATAQRNRETSGAEGLFEDWYARENPHCAKQYVRGTLDPILVNQRRLLEKGWNAAVANTAQGKRTNVGSDGLSDQDRTDMQIDLEAWAQTPEAQGAALTDDARECLEDVTTHYGAFVDALTKQKAASSTKCDREYWQHELNALARMNRQARAALAAPTPVSDSGASIDAWEEGAKFALRAIAKHDLCFLTDSMKLTAIKLATDACVSEKERLAAAKTVNGNKS